MSTPFRLGSLVLLLVAAGCEGEDKSDADGDGFAVGLDCDDKDANVNPSANEACNEIDDNCNGSIDELATINGFPDGDRDGFGDTTAAQQVCADVDGFVTVSGDCDDSDPNINPDAAEDCDDIDKNCDGNATSGATDFPTFYADTDRDSFGSDAISSASSCTAPPGYVEVTGDCDDSNGTAFPGGTEVCDGADNDCNGQTDDNVLGNETLYDDADGDGYGNPTTGAPRCAAAGLVDNDDDCDDSDRDIRPTIYYADVDGDDYGDADVEIPGCTQPPNSAVDPGDCDDGSAATNPGAPETCAPGDQDCNGSVDDDPTDGTLYYSDSDADTFGDPLTGERACSPIPGTVTNGADCNDRSDLSYPGGTEACDTLDNDCNLLVDDGVPGAPIWFTDGDGDLFGAGLPIAACSQPGGTSASSGDCDDAEPNAYPGNLEICDGIDNDCDNGTLEANVAVSYRDADGDGFGDDQDTVPGCSPPPGYIDVGGDCDDADASLNPTTAPGCVTDHCGVINTSETWRSGLVHRITCDVFVEGPARPTLTILPGTRVEFTTDSALVIGRNSDGKLLATGDPLVPVVFTTANAVPQPGDWEGVSIELRDTGSVLQNVTIDSAGSNAIVPGGLVLIGADPVIDGLHSFGNLGAGLLALNGAEPLVTNSTFTGNTGNGIFVDVGAGLSRLDDAGTQGPSFVNNVITGNGDRPVTIPGSHADEIDLSNVLSPNSTEEIQLLTGILRFTGTWYDHGLPYVVANNALIEVTDGPAAQLTIEDNVEVYFGSNSALHVGTTAAGGLYTGTNTLFTGTDYVIANSLNWQGLILGQYDLGSVIADLEIAYGGGNGLANIYIFDSEPTITRVLSHDSDNNGIQVGGLTAAPWISESTIIDNDTNGVYVEPASGVARDLTGPTFTDNLLTGNGSAPVVFPPNFIGELSDTTTFDGNGDYIGIHPGTVLDDAVWLKLDEDYEVLGNIQVGGPRDPVLRIDPGVNVFFDRNTGLGVGVVDDGVLVVDGDTNARVKFSSADIVPGKGDWNGLTLGGQLTSLLYDPLDPKDETYGSVVPGTPNPQYLPPHILENLDVEYAGGPLGAGGSIIVLNVRDPANPICGFDAELVIQDVEVRQSSLVALGIVPDTVVDLDGFTTDGFEDYGTISSACDIQFDTLLDLDLGGDPGCLPAAEMIDIEPGTLFQRPLALCDYTLTRDAILPPLTQPYRLDHDLTVSGGNAPALVVEPGVTVLVDPGEQIAVACGTVAAGYLIADGATFTSGASSPGRGDWEGFLLGGACAARVTGSAIEYGGSNGLASVASTGCCGQTGVGVFAEGSYFQDVNVRESSSCAYSGFTPITTGGLLPSPPNPAASTFNGSDFLLVTGRIPTIDATFTGFIGGGGAYCNVPVP